MLGRDLSVCGWCKAKGVLASPAMLESLLQEVCVLVEMRPLSSLTADVPLELSRRGLEPFADEGGASALLLLSTSHAAIHGWPERHETRGWFSFQLSSCRDFDVEDVLRMLRLKLAVTADMFRTFTTGDLVMK